MSDRTLELLSAALEMERKGIAFYENAAGKCDNPLGVRVFSMLKNDERVHMERIRQIYSELYSGKTWSAQWQEIGDSHGKERDNLATLFRNLIKDHWRTIQASPGDMEALDIGLDLERQSVAHYQQGLEDADRILEKEFLSLMVEEEKRHCDILLEMKQFLENPAAWYREVEKGHFDGGTAVS